MTVASLPVQVPFMPAVARRLLALAAENPLTLADITVWVPSPRQGMALAQELRRQAGQTVLLPRILPLHLPAEIPETLAMLAESAVPEVGAVTRQMVLTRLLRQRQDVLSYGQAWAQAGQLGNLLDELAIYQLSAQALQDVVRGPLAAHWQQNLDFLDIILTSWPAWLAENGLADAVACQQARLRRLAAYYAQGSLSAAVWAVGFADTTPGGLAVLQAIARLPHGQVVLPGWQAVTGEIAVSDPQFPLQQLAAALSDEEIEIWPEPAGPTPHVVQVQTATPQQEATAIALMMREAWEQQQTCALVTPDRSLARRVQAELARWHMAADDSAGQPMAESLWGKLTGQVAAMVAGRLHPVAVADVLQHPLVQRPLGAEATTLFCNKLLRGLQPEPGLAGLRRRWQQAGLSPAEAATCDTVLNHLAAALQPLTQLGEAPLADYLTQLKNAVQQLSGEPIPQELETLLADGIAASTVAGQVDAAAVAELVPALMQGCVLRPVAGAGRLFIWGPLEARLQQVDRVILGSLTEGVWPIPPTPDPWLNTAMRQQLGLPDVRQRLGLAAHDFWYLTHQPTVFFTRSLHRDGQETAPSRLWERWEMQAAPEAITAARQQGYQWQQWAEMLLGQGDAEVLAPVEGYVGLPLRPVTWSASGVADLMSCPYRFYAQKILKLPELDPFAQTPEARERGELIHTWLQAFFEQVEGLPPPFGHPVTAENRPAAEAVLTQLAEAVCTPLPPAIQVIWQPRLVRLVPPLVSLFIEMGERQEQAIAFERKGQHPLDHIVLHARADRVDTGPDGVWLVDYKTGTPPSAKDVALGRKPQLAVESWLQQQQAYVPEAALAGVSVWQVPGGSPKRPAIERYTPAVLEKYVPDWSAAVAEGLHRLVRHYADAATGYPAVPGEYCQYCPYAGVCRKAEWDGEGDAA